MLNEFITNLKTKHNKSQLPYTQLRKMGHIYNTYRVIISLFLFVSSFGSTYYNTAVSTSLLLPSFLQQLTLVTYCFFSLFILAIYYFIPTQSVKQLGIGLALDIVIISLLLYTTGTPDIQLIMLYLVVVSASFILIPPYQAIIITLMAIIFVIYQNFLYAITSTVQLTDVGDALSISLTFIAVGFLSWYISQRLARLEKIANDQATEVAQLNTINKRVINNMSHGVAVFNKNLALQLTNKSTLKLLDLKLPKEVIKKRNKEKQSAVVIMQQLNIQHPQLVEWLTNVTRKTQATYNYRFSINGDTASQLRLTTTPLKEGSLLVLFEDMQREETNAQQLKLVSLGQLTASIAHEIRNPLATISQASQLLIEDAEAHTHTYKSNQFTDCSNKINDSNIELYAMIYTQTKRVNQIIEDVLKLSKQDKPNQTTFALCDWLKKFVNENFETDKVSLIKNSYQKVNFDQRQLEQILINLIKNGLRFSRKIDANAVVEIKAYQNDNHVILDIIDRGNGVKKDDRHNLFDPFFTTDSDGTGLGLYLSQSFAIANNARITYVPDQSKTCFRLLIPKVIEQ